MTTTDSEQPYFDFELQRNVTVTVGQTGFLHCRVERLGDKDVSIKNCLKSAWFFCIIFSLGALCARQLLLFCLPFGFVLFRANFSNFLFFQSLFL